MKMTALVNVWQAADWIIPCLDNLYNQADHIVVTEACWVNDERWVTHDHEDLETSPDGTAELIHDYITKKDRKHHKISFHQAGLVKNQPEARNSGLWLVPGDTSWVFIRDADEFYTAEQWSHVTKTLSDLPDSIDYATAEAKCFYFDFSLYKQEGFCRFWRWFPGQCFTQIASMQSRTGRGVHLLQDNPYYHYSYVGSHQLKSCMGEDVSKERYENWWNNVFSKYDGTEESLKKIYEVNDNGVHIFGGGPLTKYEGSHPREVENHKWRYFNAHV